MRTRSLGSPHALSDLAVGEFLEVTQDDDFPVVGGELVQHVSQSDLLLLLDCLLTGRSRGGGENSVQLPR